MKKTLSVVMTTDKNYILQTRVAIWSMLNSAKKSTFFRIYILCQNQLREEYRNKIYSLHETMNNLEISFIEVEDRIFKNAKAVAYIPVASFYRLIISKVINDSRCLFLDGDIIVNSDLTNIYDIDLRNRYLAGVKDCRIQANIEKERSYKEKLNIPTMKGYVNAGVLVFNLEMIRKDNIDAIFLSEMNNYYQYMDQDIINKCCYGKIRYLELKYNFFNDYYEKSELLQNSSFTEKEIKEASDKFGIMHFAGTYKPWNNQRIRGSRLWWEYANKALNHEDYNKLLHKVVELDTKSDWQYILNKCKSEKNIIIIGFSKIGRDVGDALIRCGITGVKCFCDNDINKQLKNHEELKVYSVDKALENYPNALWINTSQRGRAEINRQLKKIGVSENRIIVYFHKTDVYYDLLDEQYREYEEKQSALMKHGRNL